MRQGDFVDHEIMPLADKTANELLNLVGRHTVKSVSDIQINLQGKIN